MPIALSTSDVSGLATAGRMVFVADVGGAATPNILAALDAIEGVTIPRRPGNIFGAGLDRVLHNYLAGMHVSYGLSSLVDEATFMRAVRALADEIYAAARVGNDVFVDASTANTPMAHVIQAIYPDALFVVVDGPDGSPPAPRLLSGPHVMHLTAADVADPSLGGRLRAALTAARSDVGPALPPSLEQKLPGPPVFIVGCPRSGTTWLQNMLLAHPATGGPRKETAIFLSIRGVLDNPALRDWLDREALLAALRRFTEHLLATCLATQAPGATRLLEKTPLHALHLDLLAELYPEAAIIGIHRDGRDVVRSLLEVEFGTKNTTIAADGWVRTTQAVIDFATRFSQTRDERYEGLLDDPVPGVVEVLRWLDLDPNDAVMDELTARAGTRVSQHGTTGDVGSGKWRDISSGDLRTIYRVAGNQLVALGYMTPAELRAARREPAYMAAAFAEQLKALARTIARSLGVKRRR